jgi:hypothetical protein
MTATWAATTVRGRMRTEVQIAQLSRYDLVFGWRRGPITAPARPHIRHCWCNGVRRDPKSLPADVGE